MATVLRKLGLMKGDGRESEARKRLQKELFAFSPCSDHGIPSVPSALAYDHKLLLLAIGTTTGAVTIYGKPGVYFCGQPKNNSAVMKMCFLPDEARIITLCNDNSLHLWELNIKEGGASVLEEVKSCAIESSKLRLVTSMCLTIGGDQLVLGTDGGNIHFFDIATFQLTEKILLQDILIHNAPEDFKVSPGGIEAVLQHPVTSDKFLIGYNRGLIVLWDVTDNKAEQTFNASQQLESLAFNGDGSEFVSCHADGSYVVWATGESTHPKEHPNTPYGPFPCKAITKIDWKSNETGEPWMIFAGGMPRASFGDRHTVSVTHGASHITFDFSSRVIDFLALPDAAGQPQTLLVLTASELAAIDLSSAGWPTLRCPYAIGLNSRFPATCIQHVDNVTESLWNKIVAAGNQQFEGCSMKDWPIVGGQLGELSEKCSRSLLLTGHTDGSVCFWDIHLNGAMNLLYTLTTANLFVLETIALTDPAGAPQEDEWPPFRKIGISHTTVDNPRLAVQKLVLSASTETLLVGGNGGQVVVCKFDVSDDGGKIETVTLDVMGNRDELTSYGTGTEALTTKSDLVVETIGYRPKCIVQMVPAVACTTLALHADSQLIAVSTSYGVGVFDLVRMKTVYTNSVSASIGVKISRSRSFQKTLRDSFRQLRRHKSYDVSDPKNDQKTSEVKLDETQPVEAGDVKPTTEVVIEKVKNEADKEPKEETLVESPKIEEIVVKTEKVETKVEETREDEKPVVAKDEGEEAMEQKEGKEADIVVEEIAKEEPAPSAEDAAKTESTEKPAEADAAEPKEKKTVKDEPSTTPIMTSIQTVQFADTFLFHGQAVCTSLWIGTSSGHVFIYRLTLPDAEKRLEEDVKCVLVKEIRLKHGAPVIGLFVVDRNLRPLDQPHAPEVTAEGDAAAPVAPVGGHKVIVCSQQQAKIFSLPNLKAHSKYKLSLHKDDLHFTDAVLATFVSKSDDTYTEANLVCLTSQHKLVILSVPHLRCQLQTEPIIAKTDASESTVPMALTQSGGAFYCSASELNEFSVAVRLSAPRCSVKLQEGMRPVPPPPVVVAVETVAAEVLAVEALKAEPAGLEEAAKQEEKQPQQLQQDEQQPSSDKPTVSMVEVKTADDSIISANDSLAVGDVTADSIKVHVTVKDESSVGGDSSDAIASRKVIETSMHSVKTVGGTVSESTTTTIEEIKKVEGLMSECTISSCSTTTTSSSVVKVEGN